MGGSVWEIPSGEEKEEWEAEEIEVCVSWEKQGSSLFGNHSLFGDMT